MTLADLSVPEQWTDLLQALDFAERRFVEWQQQKVIGLNKLKAVQDDLESRRQTWTQAQADGRAVPADAGLPRGFANESPASRSLRSWTFVERAIGRLAAAGLFSLAQAHDLLARVREHQATLERRLTPEDIPEVRPVATAVQVVPTAGGGTLFVLGLLLSVYRDRLLVLPERIKRREGLFRVLNWR